MAQDALFWIGSGTERQLVWRISIPHRGIWRRYLTNEPDPASLPPGYAVALYYQRWGVEDAYAVVKRLLGLAYLWVGSENGVQLQLWREPVCGYWLLYAVLADLTDAVAEALDRPVAALSLEMVYRSLYFFTPAYQRGEPDDPVAYLAAKATPLDVLKRQRQHAPSPFADLCLTFAAGP